MFESLMLYSWNCIWLHPITHTTYADTMHALAIQNTCTCKQGRSCIGDYIKGWGSIPSCTKRGSLYPTSVKKIYGFHYMYILNFTDYPCVEFNLLNYQKYTVQVMGAIIYSVDNEIVTDQDLPWGGGQTVPLALP